MSRLSRPRVLLADDHRLVAEGIKSLLSAEFDLVGVVEDGFRPLKESNCSSERASNIGCQVRPPLLVFHAPPVGAVAYRVSGSVGWRTISLMRPLWGARPKAVMRPACRLVGPWNRQSEPTAAGRLSRSARARDITSATWAGAAWRCARAVATNMAASRNVVIEKAYGDAITTDVSFRLAPVVI